MFRKFYVLEERLKAIEVAWASTSDNRTAMYDLIYKATQGSSKALFTFKTFNI